MLKGLRLRKGLRLGLRLFVVGVLYLLCRRRLLCLNLSLGRRSRLFGNKSAPDLGTELLAVWPSNLQISDVCACFVWNIKDGCQSADSFLINLIVADNAISDIVTLSDY